MKNKVLYYFGSGHLDNLYIGVDGGSLIRLPFMRELVRQGWKIKWLGFEYKERKHNNYLDLLKLYEQDSLVSVRNIVEDIGFNFNINDLQEDGILFIELRPYHINDYNFEKERIRQSDLIKYFAHKGRKIFIHDQDGWYKYIPDIVAEKCNLLCAYENYEEAQNDLRFKSVNKFIWAHDQSLFYTQKIYLNSIKKLFHTTYCGNVYGRKDDFLKFFKPLHDSGKKICVAGNWLRKKYDDRDFSLDNFPNNIWLGQTEHWSTLPLINLSEFVIHVSNPTQQRLGIICIRVFEAYMAQVPIFVNKNIYGIENYVDEIQLVSDGKELLEKVNSLNMKEVFKKFENKIQHLTIQNHVNKFEQLCENNG